MRRLSFGIMAAVFASMPFAMAQSTQMDPATRLDRDLAAATIRSEADFERYRRDRSNSNPLNRLSVEGMERLTGSLVWTAGGLASIPTSDILRELSPSDAYRVLALFGYQSLMTDRDRAAARRGRYRADGLSRTPSHRAAEAVLRSPECTPTRLTAADGDAEVQFDCWMAGRSAGRLGSWPLALLLDAETMLYSRSIHLGRAVDADSMKVVVEAIDARPHQGRSEVGSVHRALMAVGRAEEAEALIKRGQVVFDGPAFLREPLAGAVDPRAARYWRQVPGTTALREYSVRLDQGVHVVVYGSAGCGFCQRAAADIRGDDGMRRLFEEQGIWVEIPPSNHGLPMHAQWRDDNAEFPISFVYDRNHWPMAEDNLTPTFVFVKDGQVAASARGWSKEQLERLRQIAKALGAV